MTVDDLINRQAVINALVERTHFSWETLKKLYPMLEVLEWLPSVQPETCEYWDRESNICALYRPSAVPAPKTVIYSGDGYADGCMIYDSAECPKCGYTYENGDNAWGEPYCPHCGQLLNWDAENE